MNKKLNMFVITHKDVDLSKYKLDDCYKTMMVGKKEEKNSKYLYDSTKDNISNKNKNYCELTGLYWIWKNVKSEYIGLCHYRRFFLSNKNFKILKEKEILEILDKYDIIMPAFTKTNNTIYEKYKQGHYSSDLDEIRKILEKDYPDYVESFDKVMNGKKYYQYNMFIAKKEIMDKYCEWLFDVFNKLEKVIDISDRDDYQKRVYGFLSERIFYVWVMKNNLKIHDNLVLNTELKGFAKVRDVIYMILKTLKLR